MSEPMPTGQSTNTVRRRAVVKGVAWAAPTMATVAAAPAMAASRGVVLRTHGRVTQTQTSSTQYYVRWRSATVDSAVPYPGVRVTGLRSTDRVTNVCHTLWYRRSDARFQLESGASANGWSVPTYTPGNTKVIDGNTFYGYTSCYSGTVPNPTSSGVVYIRGANWQANYTSAWSGRSLQYQVCANAYISGQPMEYCSNVITF